MDATDGVSPTYTFSTRFNYLNIPFTLTKSTKYLWHVTRVNTTSGSTIQSAVRSFYLSADATDYVIPPDVVAKAKVSTRPRLLMKGAEREAFLASPTGDAFKKRLKGTLFYLDRRVGAALPTAPNKTVEDFPPGSIELQNFINDVMYKFVQPMAFDISNFIYAIWYNSSNTVYINELKRRTLYLAEVNPNGVTNQTVNDLANRLAMLAQAQSVDCIYNSFTSAERTTIMANVINRAQQIYDEAAGFDDLLIAPHNSHGANTLGYMAVMAIACLGETPIADTWATSTVHLYFNLYSAWSAEDGGFGNGLGYALWDAVSTTQRWDFLKWSTGINVVNKQFVREWPLQFVYFAPHGSSTGGIGFGDGSDSDMTYVAATACVNMVSRVLDHYPDDYEAELFNYYCSQFDFPKYVDYRYSDTIWSSEFKNVTTLTKTYPKSIHLKTIGWAAFHSSMTDNNRTALFFRSGKYGSWNHNSAEQLCFTLFHKQQAMFISSGYYDSYHSPHHKNWRKTTRAQSGAITMDGGIGQKFDTMDAFGTITQYGTSDAFDFVTGDAIAAYNAGLATDSALRLTRAKRSLVYLRGVNQFLIFDKFDAVSPRMFEWNIHAYNTFTVVSDSTVKANRNDTTACLTMLHVSAPFSFSQTDQFPPNAQVNMPNQWHGQFRLKTNVTSVSFIVLVDPDCTGHVPEVEQSGENWTFSIGNVGVVFDGDALQMTEPSVPSPNDPSPSVTSAANNLVVLSVLGALSLLVL